MAVTAPEKAFRKALVARLKALRTKRDMSQSQVARALHVELETYKKWEQRGAMPPYIMETFARMVGVSPGFVLTGHTELPKDAEPQAPKRRARA